MLQGAIIGFGGLGKSHFDGIQKLADMAKIVAVCDVDSSKFEKAVTTNLHKNAKQADLSGCRLYTNAYDMLEKETLDFVIIATPTYLHAELAVAALDKGIHVLSEKPMSRTLDGCRQMIEAAKRNQKLLSIGQCLRFSPQYLKLKELVDSQEYGKLLRLEMNRLSQPPTWGYQNWFMDFSKCGGAALDLHVHDVDFMQYMLGMPQSVSAKGGSQKWVSDHISTQYTYENGPAVRITGDWSLNLAFGFRADYFAVFERGVCYLKDDAVYLCPDDGEKQTAELDNADMYVEEKRYFFRCIQEHKMNDRIAPESAMQSIQIIMAEMESAKSGQPVLL